MEIIIIKVTFPNIEETKRVCTYLLQHKLISSANYFPIKSISSWTGSIKEVKEYIAFLKTKSTNWEKVRDKIKEIHPYKIPCIIKINAEANVDYKSWIISQTQQ